MKNVKAILAAAVVAAGLGSTAKAISLGALIGDPTYNGQLVFKYTNYDEGQLYDMNIYGPNPTGGTPIVIGQQPIYNPNLQSPNPTVLNPANLPGVAGHVYTDINSIDSGYASSDAWGIFQVTSIHKVINNVQQVASWSDTANDGIELTGVFWGIQDIAVTNNGGGSVTVYGQGANYAMFLDTTPDFNAAGGPIASVLATADDGVAVLTGTGSPIGLPAAPLADFYSTYVIGNGPNPLQPVFGVYSNGVSLGTTATVNNGSAITGLWNTEIAPGYQVQFTGVPFQNNTTQSWDVLSNDPLMVTVIPTPTAVWGGVIMAGFVGLSVIRRRRAE